MDRRILLSALLAAPVTTVVHGSALAQGAPPAVEAALKALQQSLPGTISACVVGTGPKGNWEAGLEPLKAQFIGSAFKTFVLAQVLRAVEQGSLNESDQWTVDDAVRNLDSQTLLNLTGSTTARCVLEAMICHSDNTATDISMAKVTPAAIRSLIQEAKLRSVRIPDSTRRLISYIAGAPLGTDIGWKGVQEVAAGKLFGDPRPAINNDQTMLSNARDLVLWYQKALTGAFFAKPATLVEFKRILSIADALPAIVPEGLASYGKGGAIQWRGFNCFSVAGQMVVGEALATFCFILNWDGPEQGIPAVFEKFGTGVAATLAHTASVLRS
ncbi:serine hydrolase [Xanthobacteraceae bacterium A53D]